MSQITSYGIFANKVQQFLMVFNFGTVFSLSSPPAASKIWTIPKKWTL